MVIGMDIQRVRAAIHRLGRPHGHGGAARGGAAHGGTERGASVVEYALLIALIAIVLFSAVSFLGDTTDASFSGSASSILEAG
jgi:pilus assembly protein Flp/PilA